MHFLAEDNPHPVVGRDLAHLVEGKVVPRPVEGKALPHLVEGKARPLAEDKVLRHLAEDTELRPEEGKEPHPSPPPFASTRQLFGSPALGARGGGGLLELAEPR